MSFSLTIKAGDSYAFRFPALEPKTNVEIWSEKGHPGGISGYWEDFKAWVDGGNDEDEEAFLNDRAKDIVRHRITDLTGWSILAHMRDGSSLVDTLDVRAEVPQFGGLMMYLPATQTADWDAKTYQAQIQFSKGSTVLSSDIITIKVEKDVTYV